MLLQYEMPIVMDALLKVARHDGTHPGTLEVLSNVALTLCTETAADGYLNYVGYPIFGWDAVFHASRLCLASTSPVVVELGWKLIDLCTKPDNDCPSWLGGPEAAAAVVDSGLWTWLKDDYEEAAAVADWHSGRLHLIHTLLVRSFYPSERLVDIFTDPGWQLTSEELTELVSRDATCAIAAWTALGGDETSILRNATMDNSALLTVIGNAVPPEAVLQASAGQVATLIAYVSANPERIQQDPRFGVALASMPEPQLQDLALAQLTASGALAQWWIPLAECGLPRPLAAASEHIRSLTERDDYTNAVLAAIDSGVAVVRDMGLDFLDQDDPRLDNERAWDALLHSDDSKVQARVAEESLVRNWANDDSLADFDRRLLITRRRNRRAKEWVKTRLEGAPPDESTEEQPSVAPQRIDALLEMAQGSNVRDREWALRRIAILSLNGVDVPATQVSLVTTGGADGQL